MRRRKPDDVITDPDDPNLPINQQVAPTPQSVAGAAGAAAPQPSELEEPLPAEGEPPPEQPAEGAPPEWREPLPAEGEMPPQPPPEEVEEQPLQGIEGGFREPLPAEGEYEAVSPHLTTFYYPETPEATRAAGLSYRMEGGTHGAGPFSDLDLRDHTLEKFRSGKSPFVAVAMPGVPTGKMFTMDIGGRQVLAKNVDTGGGLRSGQVDVATSNPRLAAKGLQRGAHNGEYAENAPWPLNAEQAALHIGKDPSQITHADINRILQPQIEGGSRALLAGEPTAASMEAAQDTGQPEQQQVAEEPLPSEIAQGGVDAGTGLVTGVGGGDQDIVSGDMPMPDVRHLGQPRVLADGTRVWADGAVKYHPNTDTAEWTIAGKTFFRTGEYGKVNGVSPKIMRDAGTGTYWNMTDPSHPVEVQLPNHAPQYRQNIDPDPSTSMKANLAALEKASPTDAASVKMFANYMLPINAKGMKVNPEFLRLLPYINAQINVNHGTVGETIDPREYARRQNVLNQYSDQTTGKPGQIISGFQQALTHLGQVKEAADALNLPKTPLQSTFDVWLKKNLGKPEVAAYNAAMNTFTTELSRAFKGSAVDQADIDRALQSIGTGQGRDALNNVITKTLPRLIEGALERQNFGYRRTMREDLPTDELLSPDAIQALQTLGWKDKFAGRIVTPEAAQAQGQAADRFEQQAVIELKNAGKMATPQNIKNIADQLRRQASPTPTP